jgi:hypothetical protein
MSDGPVATALELTTANWVLGALVLSVGVLLPLAIVARNNKLLFRTGPATKRSS